MVAYYCMTPASVASPDGGLAPFARANFAVVERILGGLDEVTFEGPDRRGRPSSGARLVEDVLDVVAGGLH